MGLFEWLSQILQLARQFLLLFKKGLLLISFLVKDNDYQSYVNVSEKQKIYRLSLTLFISNNIKMLE
jgi:hypothetical protein